VTASITKRLHPVKVGFVCFESVACHAALQILYLMPGSCKG
jgi:hypothetical protein